MMFIDFLKAREGKNKYGMLPQNFNRRTNVAMEHNVKVLCDVAVSMHFTINYKVNFNRGNNTEFCTSPAILQNTCYVPLNLEQHGLL